MTLSVLGILISLAFLVILALRGFHIIVIAPLAVIIAALFSSMDVLQTLTGPYMKGFVNYAAKFYLMFLVGSIFGKVMEDSGAAKSIAYGILKLIGRDSQFKVVLAVSLITLALTFGGVSLFVVIFAIIPIARPLFKELNVPWHLFMIPFSFGIGSISMTMFPGTPSILNIMPTKYMATTPTAGPILGIVGSIVVAFLNVWYMKYAIKKAAEKGEGYVAPSGAGVLAEAAEQKGDLPNPLICLLPPVVLIVLLNIVKLDIVYSLAGASVLCVALFWNRFNNVLDTLNKGGVNTVIPIVNTCADVGYGMAIAATAGFKVVSDWLLSLSIHPIISLSIATNIMAGITGSASGGLGIILETLAPKYLALGLNPELVHRIAVMSAGALDALPHNGVIITTLAVAGLTHMNSYKHVWWCHVVTTIIALLIVIPLGVMIYG